MAKDGDGQGWQWSRMAMTLDVRQYSCHALLMTIALLMAILAISDALAVSSTKCY